MFKPTIKPNGKFAVFAFSNLRQAHDINTFVGSAGGYTFSTNMIDFEKSEWEKCIGELKFNRILSSNYCIVRQLESENTEMTDSDTKMLEKDFDLFYKSLMIGLPYAAHHESYLILGQNTINGVELRRLHFYPETYYLVGSPKVVIYESVIERVLRIHKNILPLYTDETHERLYAMISVFIQGLQSRNIAERIHNFVRCIEGFLLPDLGKTRKQFKSRTEVFLGPSQHKIVGELYDIRSNIEHLHNTFEKYPNTEETTIQKIIFMRALQAEFIARSLLQLILQREDLYNLFSSYTKLKAFWKLPTTEREDILGLFLEPSKEITIEMVNSDGDDDL